jgi:4-hydroxybenzoate decarboxylase
MKVLEEVDATTGKEVQGYKDLRTLLPALEANGQLLRVTKDISPEPGVRGYLRAASAMENDGPAVMFNNVVGYRGKQLLINTHGSWANLALIFGRKRQTPVQDLFYDLSDRWDRYPGEVKWVKNAPCQEHVIKENINLYDILPLVRINPFDAGFFLSKASVISRDVTDPDTFDTQNIGMYRIQVQGPDTVGLQALPFHDMGIHLKRAEELNKPLPVAICLGAPPTVSFFASSCLAYDESEYKFVGALNGEPLEVTKALTTDLDVPAYSEYVLEGYVIPRQRFPEGPFGEFPGSYSGVRAQNRIKITAVTHRTNPIMETLYIGRPWTEHDCIDGLATSITLYKQLRQTMPEVTALNATFNHGLTVIIATKNRFGGFAKSVAFRLASTPHGVSYAKNIILVDHDVDPFNFTAVMTALSTRVRADKDVAIITNTPGMPLDPSSEPPGMGNKLIIDATTPAPPDAVLREVRMVDPVPSAKEAEVIIRKFQEDFLKKK